MNEIAKVCDLFGAEVDRVGRRRSTSASARRSCFPRRLRRSCFPKDVKALTKFSSDKKYDFKILKRSIGQRVPERRVVRRSHRISAAR